VFVYDDAILFNEPWHDLFTKLPTVYDKRKQKLFLHTLKLHHPLTQKSKTDPFPLKTKI